MQIQVTAGVRADLINLGQIVMHREGKWATVESITQTRDGLVFTVMPTTRTEGKRQTMRCLPNAEIEVYPSEQLQATAIGVLQRNLPAGTVIRSADHDTITIAHATEGVTQVVE